MMLLISCDMFDRRSVLPGFGFIVALLVGCLSAALDLQAQESRPFYGALLSAEQATVDRLTELKSSGVNAVAIPIHNEKALRAAESRAFERVQDAGLSLCFWIEVARCRELADAHPDWMASLQGHPEWRRLFRDVPLPRDGEVVKTYPWVPILNKEPFNAQLLRLKSLLDNRPTPAAVFLNDVQGAPSACGCGHHLCRWTTDYGKLRTTSPLGPTASADFVAAVKALTPSVEVVPVWATECEEHDGAEDGLCGGVGCFKGICWKAWSEQLQPVADQSRTIGVLLPYKDLQRDLPLYGPEAGWIGHAVKMFSTMPARYKRPAVSPSRLLAVLQGWNVEDGEVAAQIDAARVAGVQRVLVAYQKIDQSWQPRVTKIP